MSDAFFKAISDANRRRILLLLKKQGILSAGEISEHFSISKAALSEHLKTLRNADLIAARKEGQFIYYSLNTTVFEDIMSWVMNILNKDEVQNDETQEL